MIAYAAHQNNRGVLNLGAAFVVSATLAGSLDTSILLASSIVVQPSLQAALTTQVLMRASLAVRQTLTGSFDGSDQVVAHPARTYRVGLEDRVYTVGYENRTYRFEPEDGAHLPHRSLQ